MFKEPLFFFRNLSEEGVDCLLDNRNLSVQQATQEVLNVSCLCACNVQESSVTFLFLRG